MVYGQNRVQKILHYFMHDHFYTRSLHYSCLPSMWLNSCYKRMGRGIVGPVPSWNWLLFLCKLFDPEHTSRCEKKCNWNSIWVDVNALKHCNGSLSNHWCFNNFECKNSSNRISSVFFILSRKWSIRFTSFHIFVVYPSQR